MPKITRHGGPTGVPAEFLPGGDTDGGPVTSTYDPSEHKAPEVVAYLADHPDEVAAVVAREKEGQGRKTILRLG